MTFLIFLTISLISNIGYSNEKIYHINDCVVDGASYIYKILKVGDKGGFLLLDLDGTIVNWTSLHGGLTVTDCFNTFDKIKCKSTEVCPLKKENK